MSRDKSEELISKKLKGQLTSASGAVNDDSDIKIPGFLIECKRRDTLGDKVFLDVKYWEKLKKQCVRANRSPVYMWQVNNEVYCITYLDIIKDLLLKEKYDIINIPYKEVINKRNELTKVVFNLNEYYTATCKVWEQDKIPIIQFLYKKIDLAIIDFNSFRRSNEQRQT